MDKIKSNQYLSIWTEEKVSEVTHLYGSTNLSLKEICEKTGLTPEQVRNKMKRLGITRLPEMNTKTHKKGIDTLLDWTPEFAWWLGWFLSDGSLNDTQFKIYNTELCIVEKVKEVVQSENKILTMPRKEGDGHIGDKPVYCFSFRSKKLLERLHALGVDKKRDFVPDIPKELISHFLRGFFEGDGCFNHRPKNGQVMWTVGGKKTVIKKVLELIYEVLPHITDKKMYERKDCQDFHNIYITNKHEAQEFGKMLYKDCGELYLPYKRQRFDDWIENGF